MLHFVRICARTRRRVFSTTQQIGKRDDKCHEIGMFYPHAVGGCSTVPNTQK